MFYFLNGHFITLLVIWEKPQNFQTTDNSSDQHHKETPRIKLINLFCHEVKNQSISSICPSSPTHPIPQAGQLSTAQNHSMVSQC